MIKSFGYLALRYDFDYYFDTLYKNDKISFKELKNNLELYYDYNEKIWVHRHEYKGKYFPADFPCMSIKAAKRHLRKHNEIPKGTRFVLIGRFVGQPDIILYKR